MSAQVDPALVALLAEHEERQHLIDGRWMLICRCREWAPDFEFDDRAEEQHDLFRAHLAAVVAEYVEAREREARKQAWQFAQDRICGEEGQEWTRRSGANAHTMSVKLALEIIDDLIEDPEDIEDSIADGWLPMSDRADPMAPTTQEDDRG